MVGRAALALVLSYAAPTSALYLYALRLAPSDLARVHAPAHLLTSWLRAQAPAVRALPRLDPVALPLKRYFDMPRIQGEDPTQRDRIRILGGAARAIPCRHRLKANERVLSEAAIMLRVRRDWTLDDAANTILVESYYRRDAFGIDAAARTYFGISADARAPRKRWP